VNFITFLIFTVPFDLGGLTVVSKHINEGKSMVTRYL